MLAVTACAGSRTADSAPVAPRLIAEPWAQADQVFRSDPSWLGGDGALSIVLSPDRTLWLFGDSFVIDKSAPAVERTGRSGSVMARNSIGIQEGAALASARMRFYWRSEGSGQPRPFFEEPGASADTWLWPAHGLRVPDCVIVFMHRMQADSSEGGLGFRPVGHVAFAITNVDRSPAQWRVEPLAMPELPSVGLLGASVLRDGEHVYAFGVRDPGDRALTVVRWPAEAFFRADLSAPEVWTGEGGFVRNGEAAAVIAPVATELSVTRDPRGEGHGFVLVHSEGFGVAPIAVRFARALTGPWSEPTMLDLTPYVEQGTEGTLVYAAKAHPEQQGHPDEWIVTYAVNSLDPTRIWRDLSIYYPRVLRIRRSPRRSASGRPELRSRAWRSRPARVPARPAPPRTTCAARASQPAHP